MKRQIEAAIDEANREIQQIAQNTTTEATIENLVMARLQRLCGVCQ